MVVFEWVALVVAFGIFFAVIIDKYIDHCECKSCNSTEADYQHINSE